MKDLGGLNPENGVYENGVYETWPMLAIVPSSPACF